MANILGKYGQAREESFFKREQEADIQELRKRLIKQGRFNEDFLGSDAFKVLEDADGSVSPVLMEVLQIQARMSVPDAARRRVWELRRRAGLPPLPEHELAKAVRQLKLGSAALLVPSEMTLSQSKGWRNVRNSSSAAMDDDEDHYRPPRTDHPAAATRSKMVPEMQHLSSRQLAIALRTTVYGTAASVVFMAGAVTAVAAYYGVWTAEQGRSALKSWGQSWREPIRNMVMPWAEWARSWRPD